jgi:hypothetical protein
MKIKILLILFIFIVSVTLGIIYLNNVVLPTKLKSLIINSLKEQTKKEVSLGSLQFNIFKGLVIRNLLIYDKENRILNLKEASCTFLIPPIFKRTLVISAVKFNSPKVFLERRQDGTFNLWDFFSSQKPSAQSAKFKILIRKIYVKGASIHFQDNAFPQPFTKDIENLDLVLALSLPASVKFSLSSQVKAEPAMLLKASGEFIIPTKELKARIELKDLSPQEFSHYYESMGISIAQGIVNSALIDLRIKDEILDIILDAQNQDLYIAKDAVSSVINGSLKAEIKYSLKDKQPIFKGRLLLSDSRLSGLAFVGDVSQLSGEIDFNDSEISAQKLNARIFDMPVGLQVNLTDFKNPQLTLNVTCEPGLATLSQILKDKFKFVIPAQLNGDSTLVLHLKTAIPASKDLQFNGTLDIKNASAQLEKVASVFEDINGKLDFNQEQLSWSSFTFKWLDIAYSTQGSAINFLTPEINLALSSKYLSLESLFSVNNKIISISKCAGRYFNSEFSTAGDIDVSEPKYLAAKLNGKLKFDLQDLKECFKKASNTLEKLKPEGIVNVQFDISGDIKDIKSCTIDAKASGDTVSLYGLKAKSLVLNYNQAKGIADISPLHFSFYEGDIEAGANINFNSDDFPYLLNLDIQGVKLDKLKLDTQAKEKDLAGTVKAHAQINGSSLDTAKINGAGNIAIKEGKLWQLNLFKGLGALLFSKQDFTNIVFSEGYCDFLIKDKYIFTDNLTLKSNITDLTGKVKIGFDSSLDTSLNVHVLDEMVPISGTFKDITTAIIGQAGRFGVIRITGTLHEPKYKFQPAVVDIIKGLSKGLRNFILDQ